MKTKFLTYHYVGPRGHELVFQGKAHKPTLTVENYMKWYTLFLVYPDGTIESVDYPTDGDYKYGSPYVDHVPNPMYVSDFARRKGYSICRRSLEMMIGRWELEAKDNYRWIGG